ncbi:MAG: PorV/PorQ family protein [bacterium]|nr:PorV/PorQ family protein [bacterium]
MNKIRYLLILLTFSIQLLASSMLFALDLGFAKEDGGRPGAFLSYGAGARSLAMGKTFVGVADDASATYWNPAGLGLLTQKEINTLFASLYERTDLSFASYVHPLRTSSLQSSVVSDFGTIGVSIVNLTSRGFQLRDENNYDLGEGGVTESAAIISYGKQIQVPDGSWQLAFGMNGKLVSQNVDARSDTDYGLDLGILATFYPWSVGLAVQNVVAPQLTLLENTNQYPVAATLGAGYRLFSDSLLLAVDVNKMVDRAFKVHFGAEYSLAQMMAIRAGIDETELTAGLGFTWQKYTLDYAFAYHDAIAGQKDLGVSHRMGISVKF